MVLHNWSVIAVWKLVATMNPMLSFLRLAILMKPLNVLKGASKDSGLVELVAQRAWKRTQSEHLYSHRAQQLLTWIGSCKF